MSNIPFSEFVNRISSFNFSVFLPLLIDEVEQNVIF